MFPSRPLLFILDDLIFCVWLQTMTTVRAFHWTGSFFWVTQAGFQTNILDAVKGGKILDLMVEGHALSTCFEHLDSVDVYCTIDALFAWSTLYGTVKYSTIVLPRETWHIERQVKDLILERPVGLTSARMYMHVLYTVHDVPGTVDSRGKCTIRKKSLRLRFLRVFCISHGTVGL